jgi:carbon storage regulator
MLILSRKNGESVVVGENDGVQRVLKVTVLDIRGRKVRLGFEVDASVPVHRFEVWERIRASGRPDGTVNGSTAPRA